jgi:putative ABC transport system permease protein
MFKRKREQSDFNAEVEAHLAHEVERLKEQGMSEEEARAAARRAFGNVTRAQERFYESNRWVWFDQLFQDIRYGLRQLRRNPGFTTVAVVTLALSIGANTAIFSVVDASLLKPLHFKDPSSLVMVWEKNSSHGLRRNTVAPPNLFGWEQQNHCFSAMTAFMDQPVDLTGAGEPEQVDVQYVSPNFFSLLGVNPALGRGFSQGEGQPGKSNVVVLSDGLWKSKFGGDPNGI